jgi:hypothetical protein
MLMSRPRANETKNDDRITVRMGPYLPHVRELAALDGRSISAWARRQLVRVIRAKYGGDLDGPARRESAAKVA